MWSSSPRTGRLLKITCDRQTALGRSSSALGTMRPSRWTSAATGRTTSMLTRPRPCLMSRASNTSTRSSTWTNTHSLHTLTTCPSFLPSTTGTCRWIRPVSSTRNTRLGTCTLLCTTTQRRSCGSALAASTTRATLERTTSGRPAIGLTCSSTSSLCGLVKSNARPSRKCGANAEEAVRANFSLRALVAPAACGVPSWSLVGSQLHTRPLEEIPQPPLP
mmetsp:Transcript_19428/g.56625  ORF Transcript_19428/g.56625 Transcript_19428/m.56625 type:complete len:219 (-) Transcript_19428:135-791(-)